MLRSLQCVIITKAGVVAFALLVCGCATEAQRQFQATALLYGK